MIEVQCTSCHTRYRIDEQVLPEGTPTFKCSRCGHVFSFDPRKSKPVPSRPGERTVSPQRPSGMRDADHTEAKSMAAARSETSNPRPIDQPGADHSKADKPAEIGASGHASAERAADPEDKDRDAVITSARDVAEVAALASANIEHPTGRTAEFLSRPFRERSQDEAGENLTFDFHDEEHIAVKASSETEGANVHPSERWEVGEDPFDVNAGNPIVEPLTSAADASAARTSTKRRARARKPADDEFVVDAAAPVYNRGLTHSAQFFLMMFLLIAIGFGATALLIHEDPATAAEILNRLPVIGSRFVPPVTPARLVALREVHAEYQRAKDGATALVITGTAENVGQAPLHVVQIAVSLRDATQRPIAGSAVYCGNNNLAPKMVSAMTPHEIEFFQKLDPPRNFMLDPSASAPFVVVFMNPPATAARYDVAVAKAVAAPEETTAGAAS